MTTSTTENPTTSTPDPRGTPLGLPNSRLPMPPELGTPEFWEHLKDNPARLAAQINSIDLVDLETTLQRHASLRGWVTASYETCRVAEERAKVELSRVRARVLLAAKATADELTKKPKTVAVLDAEVENHPDVIAAQDTLLDRMEVRGALRSMSECLGDRKDMLIQISARHRQEAADYSS